MANFQILLVNLLSMMLEHTRKSRLAELIYNRLDSLNISDALHSTDRNQK